MNRIFAVYKPKGPTSHDIVQKVRRIVGPVKVGHAGTLDPLAEGVLVLGVGRDATKKLADVVKKEKEYIADIHFGASSSTDDMDGEKKERPIKAIPAKDGLVRALTQFEGVISQVPPVYSAIKVAGKEAYKRARMGEKITMLARKVEIKNIELLEYHWPKAKLRIVTGPGVYIRALARDIGEALGVGGYLEGLRRTRVGDFQEADAIPMDDLEGHLRYDNE